MNRWKRQSKQTRWTICMLIAFVPLLGFVLAQGLGAKPPPWVFVPIVVLGAIFSMMAYKIRIDE